MSDYVDSDIFLDAGMADNTAGLQAAVDAAKRHRSRTLLIREGEYDFSGTVTVPPAITIRGEGSPGDIGGYEPWEAHPMQARLRFTGTDGIALYLPQCATNQFENFDLGGNVNATGSGLCVANSSYVNAQTTASDPDVTVLRGSGIGLAVGQLVKGSGIPAGATITAINGAVITLSHAPTVTATHVAQGALTVVDPEYPGGTNYPSFAGNMLSLRHVYVHDFGRNLFTHYLGGARINECNFGNAKDVNVWIENAIHPDLRNVWIGGRQLGDPVTEAIGMRLVSNQSGFNMQGGEFYVLSKAVELENAVAAFSNVNCENIGNGPYFDGSHGSVIELRNSRLAMAMNPAAIPVRVNAGAATISGVNMEGANHNVLCHANYPQDVFVFQFGRIYQVATVDASGNVVANKQAGIDSGNVV